MPNYEIRVLFEARHGPLTEKQKNKAMQIVRVYWGEPSISHHMVGEWHCYRICAKNQGEEAGMKSIAEKIGQGVINKIRAATNNLSVNVVHLDNHPTDYYNFNI